MKKHFVLLITVLYLVSTVFISCKDAINDDTSKETLPTGKISGKVIFSNAEENQNDGIIISLDKSDGLRTIAVNKAETSRNIVNSARSLIATEMTLNDGTYSFENLSPGVYTVYASSSFSKEKAVSTNVVVRSAETTTVETLNLTATGNISGTITLDNSTTGNIGFLVFVAGTSYMAMTDDSGNFTISDVPAGTGYQVVATKKGIIHLLNSSVTVVAKNTVKLQNNNFTNAELDTTGKDGTSIVWLGSFDSSDEIDNPKYMNAYFNMTDGCSYIFDGEKWTLLAKSGVYGDSSLKNLAIGAILSTEKPTNQSVVIAINATKSDLAKIGYVYSSNNLNWTNANSVLGSTDFVPITLGSDGKYKIIASENGYYTIAAKDSDGYVVFTEEKITNIDKIAPAIVSGLSAKYDKNTKSITVNWTNPTDSDFDYVSLTYTKGGTLVVSNKHIVGNTYSLENVEIDGEEYVFTVHAVDKAGNISGNTETSIIPAEGISVQSIELSRYHLAYDDPDQTITAIARISNAELIKEDTIVKFQIKDSEGNVTNTIATLNDSSGIVTATITAPYSSNNSTSSGETYKVFCKIGDETADTTHTARFNVSAASSLSGINQSLNGSSYCSLYKAQIALADVTASSIGIVTIQGYNLDLTNPSIQLYDSTGVAYYASPVLVDISSVKWTATNGFNSQTLSTEIPVPMVDDTYSVKVLFDGIVQADDSITLQVYDTPKFTSFTIPNVSITKENNIVTARIIGKNFDTPDVDLGNFNATCSAKTSIVASTSFTRISDSVLNVTFTIPETVGDYTVTVSYGLNSVNGTLIAKDFSSYHVGDVLLSDGTIIPYDIDNFSFTDEQKKKAVGILYSFDEYGIALGWLGLYNSAGGTNSGYYQWAPNGTTSDKIIFTDIICTPSDTGNGAASSATFTGDTDGSNNWAYICSVDPAGTANTAANYPAFNYVNNYATTFALTGEYATDWYMPSLAELCYIFRNRGVLNTVLDALETIQLKSDSYWSSSLDGSGCEGAWVVCFSDNIVDGSTLNYYGYVCCIRAF